MKILNKNTVVLYYIFIFIFETNLTSATFASGILYFHDGC